MENKKKKAVILLSVELGVIALLGIAFAWFNYYKEGLSQKLIAGNVYLKLEEGTEEISLTNVFPMTKEVARTKNDNYITFTLNGLDTINKNLYYEINLNYGADDTNLTKRFNDSDLVFDLVEIGQNNEETYVVDAKSYSDIKGKRIWVDTVPAGTTTEITRTYRLRAWLSESVLISDTDPAATYPATGDNAFKNHYASIKLSVYGDFEEKEMNYGYKKVLKAINNKINAETNACNPIWVDDNGTTSDESDDITYFSGDNTCVDMNYVWYSGKLWRITAIYPDGSMKLVTENNITSIAFNESGQVNFYTDENTTSYMYQWLNEEFYPTLYHASEFIDTGKKWNATMPANTTISTKPGNTSLVTANVGLINSYEYYNSYRNLGSYNTGYLNISYYWWLINPYSSSRVRAVGQSGVGYNIDSDYTYGVRPSIYLKSGLEFTGNGTTSDPYKIVGDKDAGSVNDYVNTRLSGEYVKLKNGSNEQLFRIIDIEDNKTKIIAMDYADNNATKSFTGDVFNVIWGSGATTRPNTWYTYLNDTYLPNLKNTYGELFDSNVYYLGATTNQRKSGYNYKLSVCSNITSGNTKVCDKTDQFGIFNIGLAYYGEMFATQQAGGSSNSIDMWLINSNNSCNIWTVYASGDITAEELANSILAAARPTVHLKSTVKILSGSGTQNDPYIVGL